MLAEWLSVEWQCQSVRVQIVQIFMAIHLIVVERFQMFSPRRMNPTDCGTVEVVLP